MLTKERISLDLDAGIGHDRVLTAAVVRGGAEGPLDLTICFCLSPFRAGWTFGQASD